MMGVFQHQQPTNDVYEYKTMKTITNQFFVKEKKTMKIRLFMVKMH